MSVPPWSEMVRVFGRIGVLSFGGPAAQIALMHRELVDRHGWLSEAVFLRALSLCMLLPGPRRCSWPPMPDGACAVREADWLQGCCSSYPVRC